MTSPNLGTIIWGMERTPKLAGPGKAHREGISLAELFAKFPIMPPPRSGSWIRGGLKARSGVPIAALITSRSGAKHKTMPLRVQRLRKRFSVRTGTVIARKSE